MNTSNGTTPSGVKQDRKTPPTVGRDSIEQRLALLEFALHETRQRADLLMCALQELGPYLVKDAYGREEYEEEFRRVPSPDYQKSSQEEIAAWLQDRHDRLGEFYVAMDLQNLHALCPTVCECLEVAFPEGLLPEDIEEGKLLPFAEARLLGARQSFAVRDESDAALLARFDDYLQRRSASDADAVAALHRAVDDAKAVAA